jgi:hypothetical protein
MRSLSPFGAGIAFARLASMINSTLMGLPSTGRVWQVLTAFDAISERANMMVAMPRLCPPGPYESSTLLTGPMVLAKYSYLSQGLVSELEIVYFIGIA